jgi:hypothetical protein
MHSSFCTKDCKDREDNLVQRLISVYMYNDNQVCINCDVGCSMTLAAWCHIHVHSGLRKDHARLQLVEYWNYRNKQGR